MDQFSALDLSVPPQRKADRDSFDYRPKAVEAWLKNLPIANLGQTSRALYDALHELNRLQVGRVITLSGFGSDTEVVLTRQLEASGAFAQYGFGSASTMEPKRAELESVFSSI